MCGQPLAVGGRSMNEKAAGERLVQSEGWDKKKRECEGKRRG